MKYLKYVFIENLEQDKSIAIFLQIMIESKMKLTVLL